MPRLHELQCRFRDALLEDDAGILKVHVQPHSLPLQTRLGIYRNNVFTNLREALRTIFPVINKLVGEAFFNYAAQAFIRQYPSPAGDLNQFGEQFASFLTEFTPAADLVYLPDMARLEWLAHKCYHAGDVAPLNLHQLNAVAVDAYGKLQFRLNPACALLESDYPVHRIWQINQPGYDNDSEVDLSTGGVRLLIQRHHNSIELQSLETGEWLLLNSLAAGDDFASACSKTLQADSNFELSHCLYKYVTHTTLVDFWLDESECSKAKIL